MRGGQLFALLLVMAPVADRARAEDVIGDLIQASEGQPDNAPLEGRRRPGPVEQPQAPQAIAPNPNAVTAPPPEAFPTDVLPIPDRWRLVEAVGVHSRWFDPYNQNTIKGDRPIRGTKDWFFTLSGVSDSLIEPRSFPLPVGAQTTDRSGSLDNFGRATSVIASQTVILGVALIKGSTSYATGHDKNSIFTNRPAKIQSWFAAVEPSYDFSWVRVRGSALYASGDKNPFDGKETGFDAIFENPQFAGADTSYWIRQSIPFVGGGRAVSINGRNGVLNSLRSSKEEGQSNFNNPGTLLLGAGADVDLTPHLRLSTSINRLWFDNTAVLQTLRQEGSIPRDLGWDYSASIVWRPMVNQNLVFRASAAVFDPGSGFTDLFMNSQRDSRYYSVLLNAILTF